MFEFILRSDFLPLKGDFSSGLHLIHLQSHCHLEEVTEIKEVCGVICVPAGFHSTSSLSCSCSLCFSVWWQWCGYHGNRTLMRCERENDTQTPFSARPSFNEALVSILLKQPFTYCNRSKHDIKPADAVHHIPPDNTLIHRKWHTYWVK